MKRLLVLGALAADIEKVEGHRGGEDEGGDDHAHDDGGDDDGSDD